jgi:FkbM family methyltransferase
MISPDYPRRALLCLPFARLELPGWGPLCRALGVLDSDEHWRGAPVKTIRGKLHGYRMRLRLSDWSERLTYFLGRYYDLPTQLLLSACLKPGDRFIDIGANVGMIALQAAALVGRSGRIDCVEPNAACCAAIRDHAEMNGITAIRIHPVALADQEGEATLTVFHGHEGAGTLALAPDSEREAVTETITVRTQRGDDVLGFDPMPPKLIKIDVEGYELRVLQSLERSLTDWRSAVVAELIPGHLERAGASVALVSRLMQGWGYSPYGLATGSTGGRHRLRLIPAGRDIEQAKFSDYVWLRPDSSATPALSAHIEGGAKGAAPSEYPVST